MIFIGFFKTGSLPFKNKKSIPINIENILDEISLENTRNKIVIKISNPKRFGTNDLLNKNPIQSLLESFFFIQKFEFLSFQF